MSIDIQGLSEHRLADEGDRFTALLDAAKAIAKDSRTLAAMSLAPAHWAEATAGCFKQLLSFDSGFVVESRGVPPRWSRPDEVDFAALAASRTAVGTVVGVPVFIAEHTSLWSRESQ